MYIRKYFWNLCLFHLRGKFKLFIPSELLLKSSHPAIRTTLFVYGNSIINVLPWYDIIMPSLKIVLTVVPFEKIWKIWLLTTKWTWQFPSQLLIQTMCEGKTRPLKYLGKNKNGSSRQIWHEPTPQDKAKMFDWISRK